MKIALINENSQAAKNAVIFNALKKVADAHGFEVVNYGMYSADDKAQLTYVQNGILAATLLKPPPKLSEKSFSKIYSRFKSPPQPKPSANGIFFFVSLKGLSLLLRRCR